jgi:glycosyltransferase involved in cell wall biosynthesis
MEVHYKLFGTDGVSLQSQELTAALRTRHWQVHSCASDVPAWAEGLHLPELSYQSTEAVELRRRIFPAHGGDVRRVGPEGPRLVQEISAAAEPIRRQVETYLDAHNLRLVHIRNLMSLPYNLPATLAFFSLATERTDIGFVMQHHDLYWEGPNASNFRSPYPEITALMDRIICPPLANARHVLINPIAAEALSSRRGIEATVIPDGFDFDRQVGVLDEAGFRGRLEILVGDPRPVGADDLVVAMPARVALNKAIELAIQFVAGLDARRAALHGAPDGVGVKRRRFSAGSRILLLLPQGEDIEDNREYLDRLCAYARQAGVTVAYGGNLVVPDRRYQPVDQDHYPFYSTYQTTDLVCYPPEHEGFGNQAIETVWARRPLVILEYPVFRRFVRDHIPHFISLGEPEQLGRLEEFGGLHLLDLGIRDRAVAAAIDLLKDHERERAWGEDNYRELRAFCGIDVVAEQYIRLYTELGAPS